MKMYVQCLISHDTVSPGLRFNILATIIWLSAIIGVSGQTLSFSTNYFKLNNNATVVTTADLYNTHRPAVISSSPLTVSINPGDGTLVSNMVYGVTGVNGLVAGDFNGDQWPDVLCIGAAASTILTNNRAGGLVSNAVLNVGGYCGAGCDVNGDGWLDLVVGTGTGVTIFTNNGAGQLGTNSSVDLGGGVHYLAVADMNGDGSPDLIVGSSSLAIYTNDGTGRMVFYSSTIPPNLLGSLAVADLNGDGFPDVVASMGGSQILVLTNNGAGIMGSNAVRMVNRTATRVLLADMHGGGLPDIVGLDGADNPGFLQIFTNSNGTFGNYTAVSGTYESGDMALADMNGDGKMDVVSVNTGLTVSVILNNTIYASPPLNAFMNGGQAVLFWKGPAPNSVLQSTTNLNNPDWKTVNNGMPINGVTVPSRGPKMFFRLISQ